MFPRLEMHNFDKANLTQQTQEADSGVYICTISDGVQNVKKEQTTLTVEGGSRPRVTPHLISYKLVGRTQNPQTLRGK